MYEWPGGLLVQTVDFFTPVVDDPFIYGQIAAANALSDVYAMGGRPLTALAIAAFPKAGLASSVVREIFAGGLSKLGEAQVALLGGHTVQDQEVKFGYAVSGTVTRERMLTNAGARAGDVLVLTKPLGTGIVATAIKFGRAPKQIADEAIRSMTTLNKAAADVVSEFPADAVHAATDITGFGFIGHSTELATASHVTLRYAVDTIPMFEGLASLVDGNIPGGGRTNRSHFGSAVRERVVLGEDVRLALFDPQTSGGLLLSVDPSQASALVARMRATGVDARVVGSVTSRDEVDVELS